MEYGGDTNLKQYIEEQNKSNCLIDEKIISDIINSNMYRNKRNT